MTDEKVVVRESELADRLGLGPEAIRNVAQRRVDAGVWEMTTDDAGETVFRIPVSDLGEAQEAAPDDPPRSIRRAPNDTRSPAAAVDDNGTRQTAPLDDADEPDARDDPVAADADPAPSCGDAATPPADGPRTAAANDLSDSGDETADLREAFRQVTEQRDTLQQEVDRLTEERDALQAERDTLRTERDAARQEAEQSRDADANLRLKRDALQAEVDRLHSQPLRRRFGRLFGRPRV